MIQLQTSCFHKFSKNRQGGLCSIRMPPYPDLFSLFFPRRARELGNVESQGRFESEFQNGLGGDSQYLAPRYHLDAGPDGGS